MQDVPVSVQAISGGTIADLAITQPEELSKLAPGLTLDSPITSSSSAAIVLRGVRWTSGGGTPAIPVYLNEASFEPQTALVSLFDIGQIEVLRGPQGTTRGASSISGAVLVNTRLPDLDETGGYLQGLIGSGNHQSLQGALNVPVIEGKLAIRLAGIFEDSEGDRVRSVNSTAGPKVRSRNLRASVRFEPTDTLKLNVMYERLDTHGRLFEQVAGAGAGYNGPVIMPGDRLAVTEGPMRYDRKSNVWTASAQWDVSGQTLSYIFGRQTSDDTSGSSLDIGNSAPGFDPQQSLSGKYSVETHEVRLSSQRGGHFLDYDIGYYRVRSSGKNGIDQAVYLAGAFGAPGTPPGVVPSPVARYTLPVHSTFNLNRNEDSFFGSVDLHLPHDFELAAGIRHGKQHQPLNLAVNLGAAAIAAFPNNTGFPCIFLGGFGLVPGDYSDQFCDFALPAASSLESYDAREKYTLYNVSLSKRFSPAVMAYGTVGSSFRLGFPSISAPGLPIDQIVPKPERATSFELGLKTNPASWVRFNIDVYQINYKGQLAVFEGISYFNSQSGRPDVTGFTYYRNVDSRVRGVEAELFAHPVEGLELGVNLSYANISARGGQVPCNDGIPPTTADPLHFCLLTKGTSLNPTPKFQASFNGGYEMPIGPVNGYVRANVNLQGSSPNYGTSTPPQRTPGYAIVDIFAGISDSEDKNWEIGLYAKNLFDKKQLLSSQTISDFYAPFGDSGYARISSTLPREIGVTARFAFGSK